MKNQKVINEKPKSYKNKINVSNNIHIKHKWHLEKLVD